MDKLKSSIEEANNAVDKEREKNVSLLHLIFPPDIAKRLWLGESIEAKTHNNVTMLFSDIVGFTSICSTTTPFMVIKMLEDLYSQFDVFCGQLDVYKVETIGDAYCVAGGLHKESKTHAQQIAWMALKMIEVCKTQHTHDGKPIRVGLRSPPVPPPVETHPGSSSRCGSVCTRAPSSPESSGRRCRGTASSGTTSPSRINSSPAVNR
ncbi:UNVERIFIED_CONTAM: hypothetical protein PYX00_006022 [Menopon gallinae]|uniref:Guanylate cyclase domain-containing protein n=1 Tax=Menopon gallinae TaxID=328185 RepID=A0AAW2HTX0_9NEOP